MNFRGTRSGFTGIEVAAAIALVGGLLYVFAPSWLPGASKRAAKSTATTAQLVKAVDEQGAAAAASVVKIGEANAAAPESPARSFIGQEIPVALSRLPSPDPRALLEAERRRAAVMEGRLDEARRLYETAARQSEKLQRERDEALAARHAADLALEQAAAAEHARTLQLFAMGGVALLFLAAFIYAKIYGVTPETIGKAAADIRAGVNPIAALSFAVPSRLHARVRRASQLATEPTDDPPLK